MLIRRLIDGHDPKYGVGSMTCSIYDTAWVSMVAKTKDGHTRWLFPPSFQYLLDHQQHDGGWQHRSTDSDGILNTLAALLAICKHITQPCQMREGLEDLKQRKSRAVYFLETKFSDFSVESLAMNPGSPVRIAKLLQGLQRIGIEFSFDGKEVFLKAHGSKEPISERDSLYSDKSAKIKSSLEAHVGEVDFDRFAQQKVFGSIKASPASTAAYLMNCSIWDDEAEAYLSHIVSIGDGKTQGGVPTRFPTTVFEITSVLTTLLDSGFIYRDLGTKTLNNAAMFLDNCLQLGSGVTGFAPYVEPDADNTAKAISTLCLLGHTVSPQGLIIRHEAREYFKTYTQDRTPSFVTNCRVLKALLDLLPANSEQMPQVEKIVKFLCNYWWTTNGDIEDPSVCRESAEGMLQADVPLRTHQPIIPLCSWPGLLCDCSICGNADMFPFQKTQR